MSVDHLNEAHTHLSNGIEDVAYDGRAIPQLREAMYHLSHAAAERDELRAKLALAEKWSRAWRNRFIDERMAAYTEASYEMKRCYAESDANDFEAAFDAAIDGSGESL